MRMSMLLYSKPIGNGLLTISFFGKSTFYELLLT